jgi:hypothetical protein
MEESCFAALLSQLDGVYGFMIVRRIFKPHKIILCIFGQYDGSCDVPYTDLPLSLEKTEQYKNILAFGVLGTLTVQKSK